MERWEKVKKNLIRKMELLEKIAANTETQYRFIHKREMRGLCRILNERELLIKEFAVINRELSNDQQWKNEPSLLLQLQAIEAKQQQILSRSKQVLQEAQTELAAISLELKDSKMRRQIENQYINNFSILIPGLRICEQG